MVMPKKGHKCSEEQKRKQSEAMKGRPSHKKGKPGKTAWNKGVPQTEENRRKNSESHKGIPPSNKGVPMSEDQKKKIAAAHKGKHHSEETRKRMSESGKGRPSHKKGKPGKPHTEEEKRKLSATHQGIPYDEWEAFACERKYCPKFNNACRESNRNKYGRRCFICNKTEKANGQKLSVHHVDMDKAQGCKTNWKLVPLCKSCHSKAHNNEIISRLGYILKR